MKIDSEFHFSPERNTVREIEGITSTSLEEAISKNRSLLQNTLIVSDDKGADYYDSVSKKIRQALEKYALFLESEEARVRCATSPKTKEELIKEWDNVNLIVNSIVKLKDEWEEALPKHGRNRTIDPQKLYIYKFNIACYHMKIAELAYEKNNIDQAWSAINHTSFLVGELTSLEHIILEERESKKESTQNSNNAQGRDKHSEIVKKEAIKLITENKPAGGWKKKNEMINNIAPLLAEFIKTNDVKIITPDNIEKRLDLWLRKDPLLIAWEKNRLSK